MLKKTAKAFEYLLIAVIGIMMALNYVLFVTENKFAPAGINGIAVMIQYKFNFSIGYMSLLINVPLCLFAFFAIDKKFSIKTLVYVLVYSFAYLLFDGLEFLRQYRYDAEGIDTVYPVIIAGLISGLAYGLLFRINSSTGGTDVVAKYLSTKKPNLNFFWVTFAINAVVAIASCFVYTKEGGGINYKPACLCLMYSFVSSFVGNVMLKGSKSAYKFVIITPSPEELEKKILTQLHHSATKVLGTGIYSGREKTILICIVNKHQLVDFEKIVKSFPETFCFVESVNETLGNFKKIK